MQNAVWAVDLLLHFEQPHWAEGLPSPLCFTIKPYYEPGGDQTLYMYNIAQYKGLESDSVILLMRGNKSSIEQQLYVGVSRARFFLAIVMDFKISQIVGLS